MSNLSAETLPYQATSLGRNDGVTLPSYMWKNYSYDSFGRLTQTQTAIGTDKIYYTPRTKTTTDKVNHNQLYQYDKDGNLTQVTEFNSGVGYNTFYSYDLLGNLTKLADAESGLRNISYDWLGRKISDELTHTTTSPTSVTLSSYGPINDFTENTYSDGTKVHSDLDILGRKSQDISVKTIATTTYITVGTTTVATTTFVTSSTTLNIYSYDTCTFGIGLLCSATSSDGITKSYSYNQNGDVIQINTLTSNSFWSPTSTNNFTYDRQGNLLTSTDGNATTTNSYLKSYLQSILYQDNNYATGTSIFANPAYNVAGQVTNYDRGSLKTINAYDGNNLNRLSNLSLIKYGTNSFSFTPLATTTLPTTLLTVATTTRNQMATATSLYQIATPTTSIISGYNANIAAVRTLNPLATSTPITQAQAIAGLQKIYGTISPSGINFGPGCTIYPNSTAQLIITCTGIYYYYFYNNGGAPGAWNYLFGTPNPRDASTTLPTNLTMNTTENGLGIVTNKTFSAGASVGGYYDLFVSTLTNQMNDTNAFIQLFKSQSTFGLTTCATGTQYSSKIYLSSVATNTHIQIPVNSLFWTDYFSSTSTPIYSCLLEGHTINNPMLTLSSTTPQLTNQVNLDLSKSYGLLFNTFITNNNRPTVNSFGITPTSQGLKPKVTTTNSDPDNDSIADYEVYFRPTNASTSSSTANFTLLKPATSSASTSLILDSYPFKYSTSYDIVARVKDSIGDWSNFATTTYVTPAISDSTTKVFCSGVINTNQGTVNCSSPDFYFDPTITITSNPSIVIGSNQNVASSTLFTYNSPLQVVGNVVKNNGSLKLKPFTKYFYTTNFTGTSTYTFETGDFKTFQNSSYLYDTLSRIKQVLKDEDSNYEETKYSYDDLSRLTQVTKNYDRNATTSNITESYTYSPTGRILTNGGMTYTYSGPLSQTPTQVGTDILSWDSRGRLGTSTSLGVLNWNDLDTLSQRTINSTTTKYYYDTEGNRILTLGLNAIGSTTNLISKLFTPTQNIQNTGNTTSYSYNLGSKPIINIDRTNILVATTTYVMVGTTSVATTTYISTATTSIQTLITDHLNSVEKTLEFFSGNIIATSTYSSFGVQNKIGQTNSNRGYTNHQQDQSDFIYMNARYYDANMSQQFISSDEASGAIGNDNALHLIVNQNTQEYLHDPQSLNAYSYVKNNPIMYTDPSGKFWTLGITKHAPGLGGSMGLRGDFHGIDAYYSGGPAGGAEAGVYFGYAPLQPLSHERTIQDTFNVGGKFGLGVDFSQALDSIDPKTGEYSDSDDSSLTITGGLQAGGSASLEREYVKPLLVWSKPAEKSKSPKSDSNSNNTLELNNQALPILQSSQSTQSRVSNIQSNQSIFVGVKSVNFVPNK